MQWGDVHENVRYCGTPECPKCDWKTFVMAAAADLFCYSAEGYRIRTVVNAQYKAHTTQGAALML